MTKIIEEINFSVKVTQKRSITNVPSFIISKSYFQLLNLEIDLLTLKMTFDHQNSTINSSFKGTPWDETFSMLSILKNKFI